MRFWGRKIQSGLLVVRVLVFIRERSSSVLLDNDALFRIRFQMKEFL